MTLLKYSKCLKNVFINSNRVRYLSTLNKMKVYVTQPIQDNVKEFLESNQVQLVINEQLPLTRSKLLESVADCDGLFCTLNEKIDSELLDAAKNLKVLFKHSTFLSIKTK